LFRIGEFAQIAQVSGRLLRFYDQQGLLVPEWSDPATGYRHYGIRQLSRLNRILALKGLGLSLDQIRRYLGDEISVSELRGMLAMKRAQLEQAVAEDEMRLRNVESRLAQIDRNGSIGDFEFVVKALPETPLLATPGRFAELTEAFSVVGSIAVDGARAIPLARRGNFMVVADNRDDDDALSLNIGFSMRREAQRAVVLGNGLTLRPMLLPAIDTMLTLVREGPGEDAHKAFGAIGHWLDTNRFRIAGPCREVFLETIRDPPVLNATLVEIQFPVTRSL
jgi:DNA-binding transcriptional MerR regulator/effector-binding domain-containing protein